MNFLTQSINLTNLLFIVNISVINTHINNGKIKERYLMASYTLKDYQMLISVEKCLQKLVPIISNRMSNQQIKDILMNVKDLVDVIQACMNEQEYQDYHEFFQALADFCLHFTNNKITQENY